MIWLQYSAPKPLSEPQVVSSSKEENHRLAWSDTKYFLPAHVGHRPSECSSKLSRTALESSLSSKRWRLGSTIANASGHVTASSLVDNVHRQSKGFYIEIHQKHTSHSNKANISLRGRNAKNPRVPVVSNFPHKAHFEESHVTSSESPS